MASLTSNFERHSLTVPLGACVTPHSSQKMIEMNKKSPPQILFFDD